MNENWMLGASKSKEWNFTTEQEKSMFNAVEKIFSELPDELIEIINEVSLNELDKRHLIAWADRPEGKAIAQQLNKDKNNERI